ncbi:serine/threonine kinase-like domain-containing protein STKLD1 [Argopecten irradians]|uniref:serine/threonine kinase-like domain-containing protein STKLD1 n=1 Tax=Argopecten irradians TaxID=31199 RepID=UPI00372115EE
MENYKILRELGHGAQATIYLAEKLDTGKSCVLKKVECFDESEANKAFRESQDLLSLDHPYVSGYNEFFVMWEKENSSVFMTISMDYFPLGTLGTMLQKHRESKEAIPEETIKTWVGQVIEGLVYVHQRGIIHRDLRPNNLYLHEDGSLKIGDFSVATVMGDTQTCTRATLSSANYLAPELEDTGFTAVTDIWSLGCILFELTSSPFFDEKQATETMKEAKEDAYVMEEVFEDVAKHYSGELISLIRLMLKRKDRPSALDLKKNNNYVKACVEMTDATQLEKRKRQKSARRDKRSIPKDGGLIRILEHLAHYIDYEEQVLESLCLILDMCKESETFQVDASGKRLISIAMRNHLQNEQIQITGCSIFNRLLVTGSSDIFITRHKVKKRLSLRDKPNDAIFSSDVISIFPRAMEEHITSAEVQQVAAASLMALASNKQPCLVFTEESAYRVLANEATGGGHVAGIPKVMSAYELHKDNAEVVESIATLLMELAEYDDVRAELKHLNVGPKVLSEIFKRFKDNVDIMTPCEKALCRLQATIQQKSQKTIKT